MNILKKKLNYEDGIYKYEVTDLIAKKIINFYDQHPFPNYKNENITDLIYNTKNNIFINELKKFVLKKVAEFEVGPHNYLIYLPQSPIVNFLLLMQR